MDRCQHDFLPGQCAICLGHTLGDEENVEQFYFGGLINTRTNQRKTEASPGREKANGET